MLISPDRDIEVKDPNTNFLHFCNQRRRDDFAPRNLNDCLGSASSRLLLLDLRRSGWYILQVFGDDSLWVVQLEEDVGRFQICVYDAAFSMEVIEALEHLTCDFLHFWRGYSLLLEVEGLGVQIMAQYWIDQTKMATAFALVVEMAEEVDDMVSAWIAGVLLDTL